MYYRDQLKKAEENGINVWKAHIADEVNCFLENSDLNPTEEDFEECCNYVYDYCKHSDVSPNDVACSLVGVLSDPELGFTFADLTNERYDELDQTIEDRVCWN